MHLRSMQYFDKGTTVRSHFKPSVIKMQLCLIWTLPFFDSYLLFK
jgi:hypothetical protein